MAAHFPAEGGALARYAQRFDAVEITSSFYRPHRRATYARWAASVPTGFRFAVKLPRTATHDRRLIDCADVLLRFAEESAGLGDKRGPLLVQLPPSLAFDAPVAAAFFVELGHLVGGPIVAEPRHASWFTQQADALLIAHRIARAAADPARVPEAGLAGGWRGLTYARWHGSPLVYRSSYDAAALAAHVELARSDGESWTIYDNTASGAATVNAIELQTMLAAGAAR